ncbi:MULTISPECIES: pilus assembly protein CpaB [unclassified Vibrio]|uniref:pilus assembly protein CpaB n=1 Tax=unclassified Vibrio TaxID=2614977 RepID=UPI00354E5827
MKKSLSLFVAVAAVAIGGYGIYQNLNKTSEPTVEKTEEYVQVWRANIQLVKGKPIDASLVKREQILKSLAIGEGIKADVNLDFSPATLLNRNLSQGDLVLPEYQNKKGSPGYIDLLISEGKEPYPLLVSSTNLILDYIRPGIYVDVLSISSPVENLSGDLDRRIGFNGVNANLLLKRAKVLGTSSGSKGDDGNLDSTFQPAASAGEETGQAVVIIEIDPVDIAKVSLAEKTMHLEVYRSNSYEVPIDADVRNVIENYSGVSELRGSRRQTVQGGEL